MINFENIALLYKFEALQEDNPFSKEQREELVNIMDEVETLEITTNPVRAAKTIKKYKSLEKQYLDKYNSWGGNYGRLNKTLREFEDKSIPYFEQFKNKFNELKNRMKL